MVKAIRVSVLLVLLAFSAQAGIIQNETPAPPPPSQPVSTTPVPTGEGDEPTDDGIMQNEAPSGLTQVALDVLAVLPSLF